MPSLEDRSSTFKAAADWATSSPEANKASNAVKLELYGLYKYLTVSHAPNTKAPGLLDFTGKAKWSAWDKVSKDFADEGAAEEKYISLVKSLGWTPGEAQDAKFAPSVEEPPVSKSSGGSGSGMGVSVSQMARPAEDQHDKEEDTLHGAVLSGDALNVQAWLEKHSASVDVLDAKDEYGFTALHLASDRGFLPIVKVLVTKGANVGIKDPDDLTAISLAQAAGNQEIVDFLEGYLANKGSLGQGA